MVSCMGGYIKQGPLYYEQTRTQRLQVYYHYQSYAPRSPQ